MRRLLIPLIIIPLSLAFADSQREARREIEKSYRALTSGFERHDLKPFEGLLAEDYQGSGPKGEKLTKQAVLDDFRTQMNAMQDIRWRRKIARFVLKGDEADVLVNGRMNAMITGKDGKLHKMDLRATSSDHWAKIAGSWRIKSGHVEKFVLKIDGKRLGEG